MRSKRLAILALIVLAGACHKRPPATIALPPPVVVPVVVPVSAPVPVPLDIPGSLSAPAGVSLFEQAELAFSMGNYTGAIRDYENYLQWFPGGDHTDEALFHAGMSYALRTKPPANWTRATADLRRLVKDHPQSPLRPTAALILALRSHADQLARDAKATNEAMQQLDTELSRLKKIDADRRKHP
jgi:TolA-binding protein